MMAVGEGSDVECALADGMIVVEVVWRSMVWTCLSILLELVMLESIVGDLRLRCRREVGALEL